MLLMSVTLAVAAVRLAKLDTLVQQMAATESLAAVDTICVDKTGTLTTGELELVGVEVADESQRPPRPSRRSARFAASAGERNRTLEAIAEPLPRRPPSGSRAEVPFSSEWKWSGLDPGRRARRDLRPRRPRRAAPRAARWRCRRPLQQKPRAAHQRRAAGSSPSAAPRAACPATPPPSRRPPIAPLALVVLEETLRPDAAETIAFMREQQMDLKLISGDARADRDRGRGGGRRPRRTPA